MDSLNESHPKLMEELVPKLLTLGEVGRVLEQLLRERVSIRDLGAILEALLETAPRDKSTEGLVEAARQAMGRRLVQPLLDGDGQLPVLLLDPALEEEIVATVSPETGQRLLAATAAPGSTAGAAPGRFCESSYRFRIRCGPSRASCVPVRPAITSGVGWSRFCRGWRWWRRARFRRRSGCARWERCGERPCEAASGDSEREPIAKASWRGDAGVANDGCR